LLSSALRGIKAAISVGLTPVKLNLVALKSINNSEIESFITFSSSTGAILQLIELVSKNDNDEFYRKYHLDLGLIEGQLSGTAKEVIDRGMNKRKKYILPDGAEVEIVRPMHNTEFCANCHRIRLTSDGKLKPCLMREDNLIDILTPMRQGVSDRVLADIIRETVKLREPFYRKAVPSSVS
jgi:cyclic pyranopterin phosphate synthase